MKPRPEALLQCFLLLMLSQMNFAQTAFQSRASNANSALSTLNDWVIGKNKTAYRPSTVVLSVSASLYLLNNNGTTKLADGTVAQYSDAFDSAVDWQDAKKFTNINENFGLVRDGINLAIERRPFITADDTLFFRLTNTTTRKYRVIFVADSMPDILAFWQDNYSGTSTPVLLGDTTIVDFDIMLSNPVSAAPDRFKMIFKVVNGGPVPVKFTGVNAFESNNNIIVDWNTMNEINIAKYIIERSEDGHSFVQEGSITAKGRNNNTTVNYSWTDIQPLSHDDYYRIKCVDIDGHETYSEVIKATMQENNSLITLNTNMISNGIIGLQMNDQVAGKYHVRLMTDYGAILSARTINHQKGNSSEKVIIGSNMAKGVYLLEVIKPDGDVLNYKIIN